VRGAGVELLSSDSKVGVEMTQLVGEFLRLSIGGAPLA
jgi:hypothetical protein